MDSKIERETVTTAIPDSNGEISEVKSTVPGKVLAIRFKKILKTVLTHDAYGMEMEAYVFEKSVDKDGNPTDRDAEFYAYSGSRVMIDQATNDFSPQDLPVPTVIERFTAKDGKSYTKFT